MFSPGWSPFIAAYIRPRGLGANPRVVRYNMPVYSNAYTVKMNPFNAPPVTNGILPSLSIPSVADLKSHAMHGSLLHRLSQPLPGIETRTVPMTGAALDMAPPSHRIEEVCSAYFAIEAVRQIRGPVINF
jgi:hypothetical protein